MDDERIIKLLCTYDADVTKKYFYSYCRRAYHIFDRKYNLHSKAGMDFYSLAHEYYLHLMKHQFKPLLDKPDNVPLSTWMTRGFHFVVLDALKEYNREFDGKTLSDSGTVPDYVRSSDHEEGLLLQVADAVAAHYGSDRIMQAIAHMVLYAGFKQKEAAAQFGLTPSAVNQRVKKMMDEVVIPFVIENYGHGIYYGKTVTPSCGMTPRYMGGAVYADMDMAVMEETERNMDMRRITPAMVTSLKPNEVFVFGSNLDGWHGGGAARAAYKNFGAVWGQGVGLQGQSYAIPTMQGGVETIKPYVDEFITFAKQHPEQNFLVTPIGCGIAGFTPEEIAPLFEEAKELENVWLPESFLDC